MAIFEDEEGTLLIKESYLTVIKNSVGTNLFRNFYSNIDGEKTDVIRDGDLACAFFVSSILMMFQFTKSARATVDATVKDLKESGWKEAGKPCEGSVLVWEHKKGDSGESHRHIGFYIGDKKAISNSPELGHPIEHHWTFNDARKVESIFWKEI